MSKCKDRWSAVSLPGLVKAHAREEMRRYHSLLSDPQRAESNVAAQLRKLPRTDPSGALGMTASPEEEAKMLVEGALGVTHSAQRAREHFELAQLFWVTSPMTRVALDASLDVPEIDAARDMPAPTGALFFETPLPALPSYQGAGLSKVPTSMPDEAPVSAVFWYPREDGIRVVAYARNRLLTSASVAHDTRSSGPLAEIVAFSILRTESMALGAEVPLDSRFKALLAFLSATWVLMMTPTVAQRRTIDPKTGGEPRPGTPPSVPLVTTIDLRPLRHEAKTEPVDESGRVYRHRWIVRGHWRNQAHGPGRTKRRMTWVPSYIKGPEGVPLLATEKVMVWRR